MYIFYIVDVIMCMVAVVLIKYHLATKDVVIFGLSTILLSVTAV